MEQKIAARVGRLQAELERKSSELERAKQESERLSQEKQDLEDKASELSRQVDVSVEMLANLKQDLVNKEEELNHKQQWVLYSYCSSHFRLSHYCLGVSLELWGISFPVETVLLVSQLFCFLIFLVRIDIIMAAGVFFLWTMLDLVLNARPYLGSWQDTICVGDLGGCML